MVAKILIDTREQRLYEQLQIRLEDKSVLEVVPLEIGDVHIVDEEHQICLVFERKSDKDLSASIRDGRYREQKVRMKQTYPSSMCTYIIENPCDFVGNRFGYNMLHSDAMSDSIYQGAIIHTMYRDKMHIVVVSSIFETAEWIKAVYMKVVEKPQHFVNQHQNQSICDNNTVAGNEVGGGNVCNYIDCMKVKKRKIDNIDPKTCYQLQWCQIPGISQKIAQSVCEKYPSWCSFFGYMNPLTISDRIKELSKISLIGEKKARQIVSYLWGCN